jgi:hypothetical protein
MSEALAADIAADIAAPREPATPHGRSELSALLNWLACWIVLPNLPFLPITLMGGPPRFFDIAVCGCVGLMVRRMPLWVRLPAFLGLLTWLVINFIARMFNMHVSMILSVAPLVLDLSPATSVEYLVGAILLAATSAAAIWLMRQSGTFRHSASMVVATGFVMALAAGDYAMSKDTIGAYSRLAPAGAPFTSATRQAGLLGLADGKTNIMLVMVEAMGQPGTPELKARFDRIWDRPELAGKYEVIRGETQFYGSTTSGEMRELCQRWGDYPEITSAQPGCLPAILARRGYRTASYHAFEPGFFERDRWYPLIGFQHMTFGQDLLDRGASYCPNVFPGACDRNLPAMIRRDLAKGTGPQFTYWLTLNSHLPVVENDALRTKHCRQLGARFDSDYPMICRLFTLWSDTADALVKEVARPDFPPTHILIVGDHMPPFTHQASRLKFDSEHVPWILLKLKDSARDTGPAR